jgi:DNA-directed RNA polymerase subunit RPC12/RpoP
MSPHPYRSPSCRRCTRPHHRETEQDPVVCPMCRERLLAQVALDLWRAGRSVGVDGEAFRGMMHGWASQTSPS